ncbi:glutamate carboxypeptidase [Planobispora rosea]|uniref:Glutamate carboxypeptidase n=2 Tax=Planobispora rosea TaxID=35762 RepID=A0A8J3WEJ4_PLARO|nr:M20 family metallopeptidase [Planobispora rosea]GGS83842.1 glutamate carboxypeptidase [Planobispora rosea]GIH86298.1 glutamate carboxypeptidase [Planobispora rosea]
MSALPRDHAALPDTMLRDLEELVTCESFSADLGAVARSAGVVAAQGTRLLGVPPETIVIDGVTHLRWTFGAPRVLVLGHHDTVWPIGSLLTHPWSVAGGIARGPGVFDMKAGLVQAFHALASLPSPDGVCLLVTGDEEVGSPSSRALVEEAARRCSAAFVLEGSAEGGALKTARKGTSNYEVVVHGRAAHAGLEPRKGANAAVELAHQVLAITDVAALADADGTASPALAGPDTAVLTEPDAETTVTPTVLTGGTAPNTVPALARVAVDVRVPTLAAQERVDALIRALSPRLSGTRLEILGGPNRPPMEASSSAGLLALAQRVAAGLGLDPLGGVGVGGASDGNFTAGVGCPTLDGLGAVGGGAHADDEHVVVAALPGRTALLAGLIRAVLAGERGEAGNGHGAVDGAVPR